MNLENVTKGQLVIIGFVSLAILCGFSLLGLSFLLDAPNGLRVEIALSDSADRSGDPADTPPVFDRGVDRIYAHLSFPGMLNLNWQSNVVVKWYHGSTQLRAQEFEATAEEDTVVVLEPQIATDFEPGQYKIQVWIADRESASRTFVIR